jgi:hypothetical protein
MSLDVTLTTSLYSANITHNLGEMAKEAGIYEYLWSPEDVGVWRAEDLIEPLAGGLAKMKADPERFKKFDSPNGWGVYEHFVPFVENYLKACRKFPDDSISISK